MNETKPSQMKPQKMVRRSVAVALGIICIIIVGGLLGAFAYCLNDKNNAISSLNSQILTYIWQSKDLQNRVNDLNETLKLEKSDVWLEEHDFTSQKADTFTSWNFSAPYAGLISILAQSSAGPNAYVQVIWNSSGINYDNLITGNSSGQNSLWPASFPVLPSSNVEIRVGNTNSVDAATIYVIIDYRY